MADLSSMERRKLERLLHMGGGYVFDFSDHTFSEFFEEHTRRKVARMQDLTPGLCLFSRINQRAMTCRAR